MNPDRTYLSLLAQQVSENDDEKSFETLFKLLYKPLCRFAGRYVVATNTAEEVVSDVFVKLWNNRKQPAAIRDVRMYLYVAVKNQALTRIRRNPQHSIVSFDENLNPDWLTDTGDAAAAMELQELRASIELSVQSLPQQCRMVFKLIKEDGFKYREVAEIMNLSVRTVEVHLATALKKLALSLRLPAPSRKGKSPTRKIPDAR